MCGRIGVSEGMSMGGMWSGGMEPSRCRDRSCSGGAVPLSMLCRAWCWVMDVWVGGLVKSWRISQSAASSRLIAESSLTYLSPAERDTRSMTSCSLFSFVIFLPWRDLGAE